MNNINYQKISDEIISTAVKRGEVPTLLLHSCCAPCSSYVLEYLSEYFSITVFYYNPNIDTVGEFNKRASEQKRLIGEMKVKNKISFICADYRNEDFSAVANGLENEKEGGARCEKCFRLRLEESAAVAKAKHFDFFTTTLSISPMKNAHLLNAIGEETEKKYGTAYFYSDFKKREGYKRSIALSEEHHLYRQNYCGCIFSKKQSEERAADNANTPG